MASIRSGVAKWFMRRLRGFASRYFGDIIKLRKEKEKWFARLYPPRGVHFENVTVEGMPAQWCYPPAGKDKHPERVIYYIHGGGFASCSPHSHWGIIGKFSLEMGIKVFAPDYRLAPEHPFPAAMDDVTKVYQWLLQTYAPHNIIVMGDSAGGGLSVSMLLNLRQLGLPQPLTAAIFSPWVDLSMSGESIESKEEEEPLLPVSIARQWASWYVGTMEATNPMISPIFADLNDLCPMLVHVGTSEILLSDSVRLHKAAENTNTKIELLVWENMFHVWHMAWRTVPEGQQAITEVIAYLVRQIAMQVRRQAELADTE